MSIGYTAQLTENPNMPFSAFAMLCARAFGAMVDMRDEPLGAKVPTEIKPSDYHQKALRSAAGRKGRFKQLTSAQRRALANESMLSSVRSCVKSMENNAETEKTYRNMLAQVLAWVPPTTEHEGLKKFMIEQITSSLKFDCETDYYQSSLNRIAHQTPKEWVKTRKTHLDADIQYHREEHQKEVARCRERTDWIQTLMGSLGIAQSTDKKVLSNCA